jgi:hypothetical protein
MIFSVHYNRFRRPITRGMKKKKQCLQMFFAIRGYFEKIAREGCNLSALGVQ